MVLGFAAGGYFDEEGSAAEYICLPSDPNLGATLSDNNYGSIYGAEYETNSFHSGGGLWNNDVPCAVCRSTTASHTLMIAAKNKCYDGWFTEYVGELMDGNHQQKAASSFVCVDKNPEKILGGEANRDGKLFYSIKTFCGSLKCQPYQNNRLLPCVVCSR
ncbi:unnamed protein product [Mytilus edulis]|uniref:Short-chain collagen C4-like n=1 Tax=Mytilus edulis TaxID=6550 RepID=A0A8S3UBW7_MYTED|nr:unnamed protein product [Mytilus edulis]